MKPEKLKIDPIRDSNAMCIAKVWMQKAIKGDPRAAERVAERAEGPVTANDNGVAVGNGNMRFDLPGKGGNDGLIQTIEQIYGIRITDGRPAREIPMLPEAEEAEDDETPAQ